ncbi:MAG: glycogen debranching protein [Chthoniobacterales bacterium]
MKAWTTSEGTPFRLGATWIKQEQAYNFALYSKHAESVTLLFYGRDDLVHPLFSHPLDYLRNKSGRVWHCRIAKAVLQGAAYYAYRVTGPPPQGRFEWHCFDPDKVLLDPYAESVFFPPTFDRGAAVRPGSNAGRAPLAVLEACRHQFEWKDGDLCQHESDTIIYELHVRGFTIHPSSGVTPEKRGTYAGLVDKIPYLKELGITVVELMPVFQFDPQEDNYWGYMPLNFFAPHHDYAIHKDQRGYKPHHEFREMVAAFHQAGIEVILDVVYNHTCEGNEAGPNYSFKGIDNSTYYLISDRPGDRYENFSGAGNTLNCANRSVRRMVLDSLRHWVKEMQVDGFRFDLASVFSRNEDGSINLSDPQLFADIVSDPELARVRLIAEPWDVGTYQLGWKLPGPSWAQWNGKFRDEMRRFVKGDEGMVGAVMSRLYGSDDLFPGDLSNACQPFQSINYITSHDGFTLYDLVSYNQKHNAANGQNNTDGANDNYSWNCGWEGDVNLPAAVLQLRKQQIKNFCCLLLLSNGTPMLHAGDEFMQTQGGNNNPYNQDNETSWLDWNRLNENQDIFRFFKLMIAFRKAHPSLGRSRFWREDVKWFGVGPSVDLAGYSHSLAVCLLGQAQQDDDIYFMVNASAQALTFIIQDGEAKAWKRVIDTSLESPDDFRETGSEVALQSQSYEVKPRGVAVFIRHTQ